MLKTIFLDLVPYIIDDKSIFNQTWRQILGVEYDNYIKNYADIQELFKKDLMEPSVQNELSKILGDESKFKVLLKDFIKTLVDVESLYFSSFELATPIKKMIEDAKNNECNIVFVSWHADYLERIKWLLTYVNVSFLLVSEIRWISSVDLCTYTTNKNTCVHEFLCITQEQNTINDLVEKGFFCATISKVDNNEGTNPYVFYSFQELDFETLRYNFIEVIGDESEDL